jgi:hypothetical protein
MSVKSFTKTSVLLLASCLLLALPTFAQFTSVSGKLTDAAGAVVPGVTITLTTPTRAERTAISDDVGFYRFLQLLPGTYSLKAELKGFKTAIRDRIELLVDTPTTVDIRLEVGEISQTVTVEAGASKLNTQDAALGSAFEGIRIRQLPLESRNVANLLSLQAAVTQDGYVSGARSDQSNLTLDGIDVNEQQTGEAFTTVLRVTPDSVQEFKVTTNAASATQGRSSGGQVSLITRTGNNEWHGSLYEFHRNTVTTANDFFNNRTGLKRPKLLRNLFGGSVAGPVIKDRAFFFYNYEGRRDAKETPVGPNPVPLPSLGQGLVRYKNTAGGITTLTTADMNKIYSVGINPLAVKAMADAASRYPANDTGIGDGLNFGGYRFNAPLPLKYNAHTATLNFNLTQDARHTLLVRGNYQHDLEVGAPAWPDTPGTNRWSHPTGFAIQHGWTATPKLVNTLRFGLTREAYSQQGDSGDNSISFRFVYSPRNYARTLNRITPTWNIVDDVAWVKGNHTFAFGGNIRLIRNQRVSYANSYDRAITNPSFYDASGAVLTDPIKDISGSKSNLQAALTAVIGRYSQYSGNFNFGPDGSVLAAGTGVGRDFATEEYEMYAQDSWRVRNDLTLTLGLRYSLYRPVYEANGLEVKSTVSLSEYFDKRVASAKQGTPYNEPITVDKSGPVNGKPGYYPWQNANFAPRAAFAWTPTFDNKLLKTVFGTGQKSVFRGGFSMAYDRVGSALAVSFDLNNTLGFSSSQVISANTYNVTDRPAPLFTGYDQVIRTLPGIKVPAKLTFPLMQPADGSERIEASLDDKLTTPVHYSWNFSIGREFGGGLTVEASYMGRMARNLLAQRDVMQLNNLVDPKSGMDWYTAAGLLYDARWNDVPISAMQPIPYFQNLFPAAATSTQTATQRIYRRVSRDGLDTPDWTYLQEWLNSRGIYSAMFFQPQYAALEAWSTMAYSDYHAGTLSVRERFKNSLNMELNYTFSKSIDNASGLERAGTYSTAGFILNSLRPDDNRGLSSFDITHMINGNALWDLPIGRGHRLFGGINSIADQFLGGWQLSSIFRWNTGLPEIAPYDAEIWATNWNAQSYGVRLHPIEAAPTKSGVYPNFFADPTYAYQSFRNARAGETGDRNIFRRQSYIALDFGLGKSFKLYENHTLQFRWEVFNATNTQRLGGPTLSRAGFGLNVDPQLGTPALDFGRISAIQGSPRVMQFGLRYDF